GAPRGSGSRGPLGGALHDGGPHDVVCPPDVVPRRPHDVVVLAGGSPDPAVRRACSPRHAHAVDATAIGGPHDVLDRRPDDVLVGGPHHGPGRPPHHALPPPPAPVFPARRPHDA